MKKTMMALALGLVMSASVFAENRQVSTPLPKDVPSVTLTLDGQKRVVKPTKVQMKEVDEKHVECVVYAGKDKACVKLPIAYDVAVELIHNIATWASTLHLLSDQDYQKVEIWVSNTMGAEF